MKKFIFLTVSLVLLCSCGICKHCPKTEQRDSVRVEYRDRLIYRDSLIYVALPSEASSAHLFPTEHSHLETSLAESNAWVDSTGFHHDIRNKDRKWGVTVPVMTHIITDKAREKSAQIITNTVKVEKPLSWWQRLRIGAFWWLLGLLLITNFKTIAKFVLKCQNLI